MKNIFIVFAGIILMVITSCNNEKATNSSSEIDKDSNEISSTDGNKNPATGSGVPADMKNILGEWELDRTVRDDNGNHRIDEDEEKTAIMNPGGYMKLNADGTCKFQTFMDGTYKIVAEEDGKKRLDIKDMEGTEYPMSQYIISVTEKELVINNVKGGSNFNVYKRP